MLGALFSAPGAHAHIYECVDSEGTSHFTTKRPRGRHARHCSRVVRSRPRDSYGELSPQSRAKSPSGHPSRVSRRRRSTTPPLSQDRLHAMATAASAEFGVPVPLILAVIQVESAGVPDAVSPAGAQGLMQLMPRTAAAMGVQNSLNPQQNVRGGTRYLAWLLHRFEGDWPVSLAAYNAGEGAVDKHGGIPPYPSTQRYVWKVLDRYNRLTASP